MKQKKIISLFLSMVLAASMLTGCGNKTASDAQQSAGTNAAESTVVQDENTAADESTAAEDENTVADESTAAEDEHKAAAEQLLADLTGTYQELWPVILDSQYEQLWLDNCAELVGEENAQAAYDKLSSMVTGTIYGEEAVAAYADGGGVYDCSFTEGLSTLEFDGAASVIKGYDEAGNELFSHTYHYVGMEETRGLYEYESDDAESGEFTYFCMAPDTSATTYHIEFRYGSDLGALGQYAEGNYAYWLASGISTEYDQTMIKNCIKLFCTENLSE